MYEIFWLNRIVPTADIFPIMRQNIGGERRDWIVNLLKNTYDGILEIYRLKDGTFEVKYNTLILYFINLP